VPRFIHLSDLHHQLDWRSRPWGSTGWRGLPGRFELHGMGRLARFAGAREKIERLVEHALASGADRVLLTGDLTALGDEAELTEARALLEPLAAAGKLTLIPGNHDRYTSATGERRFERVFGDWLGSDLPEHAGAGGWPFVKLLGDRHALVGLDSTHVSGWSHYFFGRVGEPQLGALARLLDDPRLSRRTVLVLVHHGPHGPSGRFDWRESGLLDAGALLRVLEGRPVVLLHGHSHHRYWHKLGGAHPHRIGGGSSTEHAAWWQIDVDDHRYVEATAGLLR